MYLPNANFAGVDTFRYKVSDGTSDSNVATATITVAGVNDAPVNVVPGTQTLVEDTTVTFSTANGNAIRLTDIDAGNSVGRAAAVGQRVHDVPDHDRADVRDRVQRRQHHHRPRHAGGPQRGPRRPGRSARERTSPATTASRSEPTTWATPAPGGTCTDTDYVTLTITPVNDAPQNVVPLITPVTAEDTPLTFNPVIWVTDVGPDDRRLLRPGPGHGRVRGRHRHPDGHADHRRHGHGQRHRPRRARRHDQLT